MNRGRARLLLLIFAVFPALYGVKLKMLLFMDINKKIILYDTSTKESPDQMFSSMLAEDRCYEDCYNEKSNEKMTYRYYIEKVKYPDDELEDKEELKNKRNKDLFNFVTYLKESKNLHYEEAHKRLEKLKKMVERYKGGVFPSFYAVLRYLESFEGLSYSVILSTFGNDIPEVTKLINEEMKTEFFTWQGSFDENGILTVKCGEATQHYATLKEIYEFTKTIGNGVLCNGLPCWEKKRKNEEELIVPLLFNNLVAFDTLKAIEDERYYIKILKKMLKAYGWCVLKDENKEIRYLWDKNILDQVNSHKRNLEEKLENLKNKKKQRTIKNFEEPNN